MFNGVNPFAIDEKGGSKTYDLPFYFIGFKSATLFVPVYRLLSGLRLYRTISGMMDYSKAIKLLYRVENPEVVQLFGGNTDRLERELERMARRKFKFVVSVQRHSKFNKEEHENAKFSLRAYPDLPMAYLEEEPARKKGADPRIFSALIDGHCKFSPETGRRRPKFRIELPVTLFLATASQTTRTTPSSFTAANTYSSLMPTRIIISRNVSKSEISWPSSKSLSFRTRVLTDNGIIGTSAILLWKLLALASTSFLRILVY